MYFSMTKCKLPIPPADFITSMHDSPYTSHQLAMSFKLFVLKHRITVRTSHFMVISSGTLYNKQLESQDRKKKKKKKTTIQSITKNCANNSPVLLETLFLGLHVCQKYTKKKRKNFNLHIQYLKQRVYYHIYISNLQLR